MLPLPKGEGGVEGERIVRIQRAATFAIALEPAELPLDWREVSAIVY